MTSSPREVETGTLTLLLEALKQFKRLMNFSLLGVSTVLPASVDSVDIFSRDSWETNVVHGLAIDNIERIIQKSQISPPT